MKKSIDINSDMGESYGHFKVGNDSAIMPYISSCSIACGFHGGDPYTLMKTLEGASVHNLRIGAHPSYFNIRGFGRERMEIPPQILLPDLIYQISALSGMARTFRLNISYVKAHGALYHQVNQREELADCLIETVQLIDSEMAIMGLPGSILEEKTAAKGLAYIREGFLDRRYTENGNLLSRTQEGAVLDSTEEVLEQLENILLNQKVTAASGKEIALDVESLCIHGDHPNSPQIAQGIKNKLEELSITLNHEKA